MQGSKEEDILASSLTLIAIEPTRLSPYIPIRRCTLGGHNFLYEIAICKAINVFYIA